LSNIQVNKELIFLGSDLSRPRFTVEREKMRAFFPGFSFYSNSDGRITSAKGYLRTNYGNSYYVRVEVPQDYPYSIPIIWLPNYSLDPCCPHIYKAGNICAMKSEQWSSSYSLAFTVARAAVWLNKYDIWCQTGRWPGKDQHRQ
jgi:ubiquitin-protein ligase